MKLYCHKCKKQVTYIQKLWCKICSECRMVLEGKSVTGVTK